MESVHSKIRHEKDSLLNHILVVFTALGAIAVAASIYRAVDIGWHPVMWVHLSILGISSVLVFFRHAIPFGWKVFSILFIIYVAAITGLFAFGLLGGSKMLWLATAIIAAGLINFRFGMIVVIINTGILFVVGVAVSQGYWQFKVDPSLYIYSLSSWSLLSAGYLFVGIISVLIIGKIYNIISENLVLIEAQRESLEIANATKDKLFSVISHDLRSPFQGLLMGMEMLYMKKNTLSEEKQTEIIQQLLRSSEKTARLLENLLTWARLQRDEIEVKKAPIHVKSLVSECFSPYLLNAESKGIRIEEQVPEDMEIFADPFSIQIVLSNLINNAIKFTNHGGVITVLGTVDKEKAVLSISDTGVGMDKETMERLFDDTDHTTTFGTDNEKGTGLGLGLCHELLKESEGEIWVESTLGEGSTFYIRF